MMMDHGVMVDLVEVVLDGVTQGMAAVVVAFQVEAQVAQVT